MKEVIINNVNYGELVKVGNALLDRFDAEKLNLTYIEAPDAHQIIPYMQLGCDLGKFQVSVFLLKKEDFIEQAKVFSKLNAVERVAIQSRVRNLVVFKDGVQVGDTRTLDGFYFDIPAEMLELTNFVAIQPHVHNLVVFEDGMQVGNIHTLDEYYADIPTEMLELTNFK